jgi:F-type H+-transporting ATPase subunit delta
MPRISSGKRYAQAVFELALQRNDFESWQESLKKIVALTAYGDFMAILQSPRLPFNAKKDLLQKQLGEIHPLALNLALLLVNKGRLGISSDIYREYQHLLDGHRGIERARVTAALPLDEKDRETISSRLGEIIQRKIIIDDQTDPSIIGGFIARIRDTLIDGSIRQRLENLKKSMVEVRR